MEKRKLGRTGLEVTQLGYGAMELRQGPDDERAVTDGQAERVLGAVLDAGINFIDTSVDYGISEERIGRFIGSRRNEYVLATKCGCDPVLRGGSGGHVWTRDHLLGNIEGSLTRLNTDYVDIWQLHNPTPEQIQAEELLDVMASVKEQGKVRHVSISSTQPHIATYLEWGSFSSYQIPYSALERQHENTLAQVAESGAGVIVRGGVAQGEPGAGRGREDRWATWERSGLDELRGDGESRSAFLLRYTISHPNTDTTIVGTKNTDHLTENLKAMDSGPLPADVYTEAKRRLEDAGERPE
jgi:aryl-alcohol dehydrogenase-like predicted oxidoreductase